MSSNELRPPMYAALPMKLAPKNGTLLRLLVMFEEGPLEDDNTKPIWTIGFNSLNDSGHDLWQFAGWNWTHDCFCEGTGTPVGWLPMLDALHGQALAGSNFQERVQPWLLECFGAKIAADRVERNHRFLEESLELVQSLGCTVSEARQLVDYVFGRPVGEPSQEVGGAMVTLAALCLASGLDMHEAGEVELARISVPEIVVKIRAKQAAKPKHSPLPEHAQPTPALEGELPDWWTTFIQGVCEIEGRNSPDSEPAAIVATPDELAACAINAIERARAARAPVATAPSMASDDDLAELAMLNQLIDLGAKAAGYHATSNSDDGAKGTAAYVQWQETRALMGKLVRAHHAELQQAPAATANALTQAACDVLAERQRQISAEGWTPQHDDEHDSGELAAASCSYALAAADQLHPQSQGDGGFADHMPPTWPWDASWWKPGRDPRRMLEKAGALILAEMERIDRAATTAQQGGA